MVELTEEHKHAIVKGHAQFMSSPEIIKMMREEFEVEISRQHVAAYNPERVSFAAGQVLRELFDQLRKVYVEEETSHDISRPAFRIGMLDDMAKRARRSGNFKLAAELLEQAAKERGGAFTNERKVSGTIDHRHRPATVEDAKAELADRLRRLQEAARSAGQDTQQDVASSSQGEAGVA